MRNFRNTHSWKIKVVKERHKVKKVQFVLSFKDRKRDYQIKFHLQKDYAQRNQEVNIKIN